MLDLCDATEKVLGHQGSLGTVISLDQRKSSAVLPELVKKVCCDHDALSLNINKARFRSIVIERHSGETARPYLCLLNHASSCGMVARTFALLID